MTWDTCCICLDNVVDMSLQCNHEFCQECITEVLNLDNNGELSCPLCRNPTFITSNPEINNRIRGIELNRNDTPFHDEVNTFLTVINGNGLFNQGYDIYWNFAYEIKSERTRGWSPEQESEANRWAEHCLNPRWNWPSYKMSDYYKMYTTPQITA